MSYSPWVTIFDNFKINQVRSFLKGSLGRRKYWRFDCSILPLYEEKNLYHQINQGRCFFLKGSLVRQCLFSPWVTIFHYFKIDQVNPLLNGSFNFASICRKKFVINQGRCFFSQGLFGEVMSVQPLGHNI